MFLCKWVSQLLSDELLEQVKLRFEIPLICSFAFNLTTLWKVCQLSSDELVEQFKLRFQIPLVVDLLPLTQSVIIVVLWRVYQLLSGEIVSI